MACSDCPLLNSNQPQFQTPFGENYQQKASTPHDKTDDRGYLALGEVIRVHPKRYTADVQLINEVTNLSSADSEEGQMAPSIGVSSAGFSNKYTAPYGEQIPIYVGDLVLIGFLYNSVQFPIILRVFHRSVESVGSPNFRNILPNVDDSNNQGITDYLKVFPIQDFHKISENGDFELSSHTKSFIVGQESKFDEEKFDYENLSVKAPIDKSVIPATDKYTGLTPTYDISSGVKKNATMQTVQVAEKYSKPKKYMAVFRDNYKDTATNWLRFVIDSSKTAFKIIKAQQKANKSTYMELGEDGSTTLKRQLDTRTIKGDKAKIYTNIKVDTYGTITIETIDKTTKVKKSTKSVSTEIASADSESTKAITETNERNNIGSDTFITTTANTKKEQSGNLKDKTPTSSDTSTSSSTVTTQSAFIAPQEETIQLFNFPAQPKISLYTAMNPSLMATAMAEGSSDTSTTDSSTSETPTTVDEAPTTYTTTSSTYTTASPTYTTTSSTYTTASSGDVSEDMEETAQTTITINPLGGAIVIKTTSGLSIDALKGISIKSEDGAVSISGKKGIKLESSDGYFYAKAKTQVVLKNDNASMGFTARGDTTVKNNMSAMNLTASGQAQFGNSFANTQISAAGAMSTYGTSVATTAPSVTTTGGQKMMGGITAIGSVHQIGMHTINGRFNIVAGDRDSRLARNFALFCNFIVAMITQFVINQVVGQLAARIPHITALLAVIDLCIGGFNAMKEAGWNGVATCLEDAAKGALVDPNSPLYKPLHDWAEKNGFGDVLSIAAQVQFLTDPEPPGMGMSVMEALESIAYDTLEEKAAAWGGAAALWTVLGSPQAMQEMAQNIIDGLADEVAATLDPDNLMDMFEAAEFNALETMATNMGCNVHIVEDDGYYNVVSTYDGTTTACLEELGHMVDTGNFSQEGAKRSNSTNDTITPGNDTVPATNDTVESDTATVNGGQARTNSIRLDRVQLMASGDSGTTTTEYYTTIEDTLQEMSQYYDGNIFDAVFRTEQYIDSIKGTNSAQYAYTNRKKRTVIGGGGSGSSTTIRIEPADVVDRDQMVDRFVKRLIAQNNIKQLQAADQAVRYACCSELAAEIETQPTTEEIEAQRVQAANIRRMDIETRSLPLVP